MMEYDKLLIGIQDALTRIRYEIDKQKQNYDTERKAEKFFCGLINRILGVNLTIANHQGIEFSCLDLIDRDAKLAVTVVYSAGSRKAKSRIQEFYQKYLYREFHTLIMVCMSDIEQTGIPNIDKTVPQDHTDIQFWDQSTVFEKIRALPPEVLPDLYQYLQENHLLPPIRPFNLLPPPPPASDYFIPGSRSTEVEELGKLLNLGKPIFIWGLGGIGKTQTAIQMVKHYMPPNGAYFIRCDTPTAPRQELLRQAILDAPFSNYIYSGKEDPSGALEYQDRLNILRTQYTGAMLIFDNLDWPSKTLEDICAEQAFRDLTELDIQLVFTTRHVAEQYNNIRIDRLPDQILLQLMWDIIGEDAPIIEKQLLSLIHAVNGHTLMVDLIAKILDESWYTITPERILTALHTNTLSQENFPPVFSDQNQFYEQRQIYAHVKALFDPASLSEASRQILRYSTLLSTNGMNRGLFRSCLPIRHHRTLSTLIKQGWLQDVYDTLVPHPVVREVCRNELMPTSENCSSFLMALRYQSSLNINFKPEPEYLRQIAACFTQAATLLGDRDGLWSYFAGQYRDRLGSHNDALKYALRRLEWLQQQPSPSQQDLASAYFQIGNYYYNLGKYPDALRYHEMALETRQHFCSPDDLLIAESRDSIGTIYGKFGNHQKALKNHLHALRIAEKSGSLSLTDMDMARYYSNVGLSYHSTRQYQPALEYLGKALDCLKRCQLTIHPDLAHAYNSLGLVHDALSNQAVALNDAQKTQYHRQKALDYRRDALVLYEETLPPDHPDLARAYNNVGNSYYAMANYEIALEYQQKALTIREQTLLNHPDLAVSYNSVGSTLGAMGDYEQAKYHVSKALAIRQNTLAPDHPLLALSYKNLGMVFYQMGNLPEAKKNLIQALQILSAPKNQGHPYAKQIEQLLLAIGKELSSSTEHTE